MNVEKQTLHTIDNVAIIKLYFDEVEGNRLIKIEKKKGIEAAHSISLSPIDTAIYNIYEFGDGDNRIVNFAFSPNSTWNINHISIGDAAPGDLTISIGADGKIISASKTCK